MMDSDSSSLSSAPETDDEAMELNMSKATGLDRYFKPAPKKKDTSPEPPPRAPSPPHEYVFADHDAIAFLVMFRSRFSDAFSKSLPHFGPQDIERGIVGEVPDDGVERYLCALLSLVLNRKKDVERGRYNRALEDAISENKTQWPVSWEGKNPLSGERSFNSMAAAERLILMRTLVLWSLNQSEVIQALIKDSYKQTRRDDDKNQPRSIQPWFSDSHRRRFWLVEGQEDSHFRVYRENDGKTTKTNTWFSVAGSIEDVNALADKFTEEGTQNARMNAEKLRSVIPRFEQGEEKRRRREYRQQQKARFARPEPGFSLYEGRTRGKRAKYTFDDGEDVFDSDGFSTRRSTRHATPSDSVPVITASGRHVRSRVGGIYGETLSTDQQREHDFNSGIGEPEGDNSEDEMPATAPNGRPMRSSRAKPAAASERDRYNGNDGMDTDSDEQQSEGEEWSGDEDEPDDEESEGDLSDEDVSGDELSADEGDMQRSLVVQLRYRPKKTPIPPSSRARTPLQTIDLNNNSNGNNTIVKDVTCDGTTEAKPEPAGISANQFTPTAINQPPSQRIVPQGFQGSGQVPMNPIEVMHGIEVPQPPSKPQTEQNPQMNDQTVNGTQHLTTPAHIAGAIAVPTVVAPPAQLQEPVASAMSDRTLPATNLPEMSTCIRATDLADNNSEAPQRHQYQPQPHVMDVS